MEILKKVNCNEQLPLQDKNTMYIYIRYKLPKEYENTIHIFCNEKIDINYWLDNIKYWYEPIEVELDSEKILPKENRPSKEELIEMFKDIDAPSEIQLYFISLQKALEVAELKNVQLQIEVNTLIPQHKHYKETCDILSERCTKLQDEIETLEIKYKLLQEEAKKRIEGLIQEVDTLKIIVYETNK